MVAIQPLADPVPQIQPVYRPVPASQYDFTELADIYNRTRVDYIVPMPMNAKRMAEYVHNYHVDLGVSVAVFDRENELAGLGMLGVRAARAWITRLGVIPERRGHGLGQFLMEALLDGAGRRQARLIQLEVIKGNTPAQRLFAKYGFRPTRELLVVRRPPGKPQKPPEQPTVVTALSAAEIESCLAQRGAGASWLDENLSLARVGGLKGLRVELAGHTGWIIYQHTMWQIDHVVLQTPQPVRDAMTYALLYHMHDLHPMQDTKIENIPALDLRWPVYQQMGYMEAFNRVEMFKYI
jgi:ribosomal protein S18 acetylase RimI-like enzyme